MISRLSIFSVNLFQDSTPGLLSPVFRLRSNKFTPPKNLLYMLYMLRKHCGYSLPLDFASQICYAINTC